MTRRLIPLLVALALTLLQAVPAQAAPGPPSILKESVSEVGSTAATLKATVNPGERATEYRFEYVSQEAFEAEGFTAATSVPVPNGAIPAGSEGVAVQARIEGLTPGTAYRFHLFAKNPSKLTGEDVSFSTLAPPPTFGPCPNDAFRSGEYAPFGHPSALLPDCRAYEQATPVDKDGGDALGEPAFTHAAGEGAGIVFGSTYGVPGAEGAQGLPFFAALRGQGDAGWQTQGLFPPAATGDKARVRGWLPDLSQSFAEPTKLTSPRIHAFYELHRDGSPATQIAPYVPNTHPNEEMYFYDGASADGSTIVFESRAALPAAKGEEPIPGAVAGSPNVYAWDAASELLSLASALNSGPETEAALPRGAFAGPYGWATNNTSSGGGGPNAFYYLQDNHAISADGSVYFTAAGSGDLYQRLNPTQPQSAMEGDRCSEAAKACTIELSASTRTPSDPGGPRPAAFQFASADGATTYFTSAEELTGESNTGPEQEPARIGRATIGAEEAEDPEPAFLPAHALGMAMDPKGEYLYWADPTSGDIGRAKLDAEGNVTFKEPSYLNTGQTSFKYETGQNKLGEPEFETLTAPSTPRYVAVDEGHLYWTNPGPLHGESGLPPRPLKGAGTVGRATIDPALCGAEPVPCKVDPEYITGATEPEGVAVEAEYLYWANVGQGNETASGIGRARIDGAQASEVEPRFIPLPLRTILSGLAVTPTEVYFANDDPVHNGGGIERVPVTGGDIHSVFVGKAGIRSLNVAGPDLYWISAVEHAIGRIPTSDFTGGSCTSIPSCDREYATGLQGSLFGLAADGSGHLLWSSNGEAPPNPGNDLYRYEAGVAEPLTDLTPDPNLGEENGAEVQGVLGGSMDGSYLYFVANGVLATNDGADGSGPPHLGNCRQLKEDVTVVSGECNLYLWHQGQSELIARLQMKGSEGAIWAPTPYTASSAALPKTSSVAADGRTLLLRSSGRLTSYDNHGVPEFYRYRVGEGISCVSCNPSGAAPTAEPRFGFYGFGYPGISPAPAAASLAVHLLSADGNRAFFHTPEALVGADVNGEAGCPVIRGSLGGSPACTDVYEWEAPGTGTCTESTPSYSPQNQGCIYLISTGTGAGPSLFADASPSGSDVYFFTRQQLVGQDQDLLYDVYDARTEGGLAAQNPLAPPGCEGEGCKGAATSPPPFTAPPAFTGPPDPKPTRHSCKGKKGKGGCGGHGKKQHRKHKPRHHRGTR
jgi:hypothetical protein